MTRAKTAFLVLAAMLAATNASYAQQFRFHLQEATIDDVHRAIREGQMMYDGPSSEFLASPEAAKVIKAHGLEPPA